MLISFLHILLSRVAQVQRVQSDIAASDLCKQEEQLLRLQAQLTHVQDTYHTTANRLLNAVQHRSLAQQVTQASCCTGALHSR